MLSDKEIVCPNNLLDVAHQRKGISAGIVNAGKSITMMSVMDAVNENLITPTFIGNKEEIEKCALELNFDISEFEILDEKNEPISQGLVLNMIDQRVKKLTPDFASYTIAKMGLWAMTQTAARALAPGIRVNAIGPGPTLIGARQKEYHFDGQRKNTILERGANTEDITSAVGYFIDAKSVTGQLLCVDGGQHLGWKTPDIQGVE